MVVDFWVTELLVSTVKLWLTTSVRTEEGTKSLKSLDFYKVLAISW